MESDRLLGLFLMVTALVVCVPVVMQVRAGEEPLRDMWGYLLFAAGLFVVGIAYALLAAPLQAYAVWGGLAAAIVGLFVHHRKGPSGGG
jgi:hypothetical protein